MWVALKKCGYELTSAAFMFGAWWFVDDHQYLAIMLAGFSGMFITFRHCLPKD